MQRTLPSHQIHLGYSSVVTGSGIRIRSGAAVSHWVLILWDGNLQSYPLTSELFVDGAYVYSETKIQDKWLPHIAKACQQPPVGHTIMTSQDIRARAMSVTGSHGKYSLLSNNCQDYVKRLLEVITVSPKLRGIYKAKLLDGGEKQIDLDDLSCSDPTAPGSEPVVGARYRFKHELLEVLNMYQNLSPGFITLAASVILVNVRRTNDPGIWEGEDRNSGISGLLLRSAVERCDVV